MYIKTNESKFHIQIVGVVFLTFFQKEKVFFLKLQTFPYFSRKIDKLQNFLQLLFEWKVNKFISYRQKFSCKSNFIISWKTAKMILNYLMKQDHTFSLKAHWAGPLRAFLIKRLWLNISLWETVLLNHKQSH